MKQEQIAYIVLKSEIASIVVKQYFSYDNYIFMLHREVDNSKKYWICSEFSTGRRVSTGLTLDETKNTAIQKLKQAKQQKGDNYLSDIVSSYKIINK